MRSVKAIVVGSMFIVVVILVLQLAYIFIAVGYNSLEADFPFLNDFTGLFKYLIGMPVFMVTMFAGGYITADIANVHANIKVWFHCFAVGSITVGGMMYSAMANSSLTLTGIAVIVLALSASSAGGFYWLRGYKRNLETTLKG